MAACTACMRMRVRALEQVRAVSPSYATFLEVQRHHACMHCTGHFGMLQIPCINLGQFIRVTSSTD